MKKLSDILESALEMQDLKQKTVAEELNMAPQTFNSYVKGHRYPDLESLRSIAVYFHLDMNDLLELTPNQSNCVISDKREAILVKTFRTLSDEDKDLAVEILKLFKSKH